MNIDLSFEQAQYCAEIVREKISGLAKAAAHLENELAKVRNQSASLELIAVSLERTRWLRNDLNGWTCRVQ